MDREPTPSADPGTGRGRLPVTLFTGQWADLPFEEIARRASEWGYDGLEIAASGDHLDLKRADEDDDYVRSRREVLDRYGLTCFAISNHLTGQAVCDDPIDFRTRRSFGRTPGVTESPKACDDGPPKTCSAPHGCRASSGWRRWLG